MDRSFLGKHFKRVLRLVVEGYIGTNGSQECELLFCTRRSDNLAPRCFG